MSWHKSAINDTTIVDEHTRVVLHVYPGLTAESAKDAAALADKLINEHNREILCPNRGGRGAYEGGDGDECASCDGTGGV